MPPKVARKEAEPEAEAVVPPGSFSATEARDVLGALLNRAGFGNERIRITDRGRVKAAIIGARDLELLEQMAGK